MAEKLSADVVGRKMLTRDARLVEIRLALAEASGDVRQAFLDGVALEARRAGVAAVLEMIADPAVDGPTPG